MDKLTLEQLPDAVAMLLEEVSRIENLLTSEKKMQIHSKEVLNTGEAIALMGIFK